MKCASIAVVGQLMNGRTVVVTRSAGIGRTREAVRAKFNIFSLGRVGAINDLAHAFGHRMNLWLQNSASGRGPTSGE